MELFFYRGKLPNFGDELNHYLWPKLLEGVWGDDNKIFIGIGSTIYDFHSPTKEKIVFGAGYGGYTSLPKLDKTWNFFFVRGKLTAEALNLNPDLAIGDSAILIRRIFPSYHGFEKKYKVSFMPHWLSLNRGNWEEACKQAHINFINPKDDVVSILEQIKSSELVICEAMHGAIVADALRVPWIPLEPVDIVNRRKWFDWSSALDLELKPFKHSYSSLPEKLYPFTKKHKEIKLFEHITWRLDHHSDFLKLICKQYFLDNASEYLTYLSNQAPSLSSDNSIITAEDKMCQKLHNLVNYLGYGKVVI